ncbi:MAG: NAD(P)H-hydrate dehydratase [Minwuia sp.]|nr:NAD(P)H-hydrate dehydratase [Minwuia sp.]
MITKPDQTIAPEPLLSVQEMYAADAHAIKCGVSGATLMESAGAGSARAIMDRWSPRPAIVLCGPGNNGGDGHVIARHLARAGWPVRLASLVALDRLKGDAAIMARQWSGTVESVTADCLADAELVVDALFGAGLTRPLEGVAAALAETARARLTVAVDVPSGVSGDSGRIEGETGAVAFRADLTLTFHLRKPGHLLMPGRRLSGEVRVIDIGIPDTAVETIGPRTWVNGPALWRPLLPVPDVEGHKFGRGHALVVGGGISSSGAARLSAISALRAGAGLVSAVPPRSATLVYASHLTAVMLKPADTPQDWTALLEDPRHNAVLIGPGNGINQRTRDFAIATLDADRAAVLDADAITVFADEPKALFKRITAPCIMTPHAGEFARLFNVTGNKLHDTREAARRSGAVIISKGPDTVIAAPDGRAAINCNAPPDLATAGSGDVLAGMAVGLLAQQVPAFEAACMAVWLHGAAAGVAGPGMIAEDLAPSLPAVWKNLRQDV